mmetsp:Transcript_32118/g.46692  ORF Transcript_32118/g.46692 Transcript_32118/m.46692 type:complete len:95 (+) Transcript_32118:126-410(+)
MPRVSRNFKVHPLRKKIGEDRGSRSVFLKSYDCLADFVVSKLTTEENDCSNVEILDSVKTRLFNALGLINPRITVDEYVELRGLAWIVLVRKYC